MEQSYKEIDRLNIKGEILQQKIIAHLHHPATHTIIAVYRPMPWLQRVMIKWCFGLHYRKN